MSITLAQLVREARLRAGNMTQRELAKLVGTSTENITSVEKGRNRRPSPEIVIGLAQALDLQAEDISAAIVGTLNHFPWDKVGDLDLKDPELELMFRQVDDILDGEPKERVKAFIRFTLNEERKRRRHEAEERKQRAD